MLNQFNTNYSLNSKRYFSLKSSIIQQYLSYLGLSSPLKKLLPFHEACEKIAPFFICWRSLSSLAWCWNSAKYGNREVGIWSPILKCQFLKWLIARKEGRGERAKYCSATKVILSISNFDSIHINFLLLFLLLCFKSANYSAITVSPNFPLEMR